MQESLTARNGEMDRTEGLIRSKCNRSGRRNATCTGIFWIYLAIQELLAAVVWACDVWQIDTECVLACYVTTNKLLTGIIK